MVACVKNNQIQSLNKRTACSNVSEQSFEQFVFMPTRNVSVDNQLHTHYMSEYVAVNEISN